MMRISDLDEAMDHDQPSTSAAADVDMDDGNGNFYYMTKMMMYQI